MRSEFHYRRRITFAETDMAGICHFANFFRYMEEAEHAFFRSFGQRVHDPLASAESAGFARGHAEATYLRPLRYDDEVDVHLLVAEKRDKSIRYAFALRKLDGDTPGELVATGAVVAVCCARPAGAERMRAVPMPTAVDAAITAADPATIAAAQQR